MLKLFMFVILTFSAFGRWEVDYIVFDKQDITAPSEIANSFAFLPSVRDWLLSQELSRPHKLTVISASGKVYYASWKNDPSERCQVADESKYEKKQFSSAFYLYYFNDNPDAQKYIEMKRLAFVKCKNLNGIEVKYNNGNYFKSGNY